MDIVIPAAANNIHCDAVKKADGAPIVGGTVNIYLIADGGANDNKWWKDSDSTWQAAETIAKAATHAADGHWYANLKAAAFTDGQKYRAYARESGDLHIPVGKPVYCAYWGDVKRIMATALTEGGAGRLANAAIKFGDVATPVFTAESKNQTADSNTILAKLDSMIEVI